MTPYDLDDQNQQILVLEVQRALKHTPRKTNSQIPKMMVWKTCFFQMGRINWAKQETDFFQMN